MLNEKIITRAIRAHTLADCSRYIFDINRPDNNAVYINEEESIYQAQDRHNRDERSDAIITLGINEQAAHMHSNTVATESLCV